MRNTSVVIDPELIAEAESLGIDVEKVLASELKYRIQRRKDDLAWQDANKEAIERYNRYIEEHGPWYEQFRSEG
jgi:post-segregation antitoxin (ccd killing protein)